MPERRPDPLVNVLGPLDGARIPGGCEACDAYQTVEQLEPMIWSIHVHHDPWCPVLKRMQARSGK